MSADEQEGRVPPPREIEVHEIDGFRIAKMYSMVGEGEAAVPFNEVCILFEVDGKQCSITFKNRSNLDKTIGLLLNMRDMAWPPVIVLGKKRMEV